MKQIVIAGIIGICALFFLIRRFFRIFTGKGSACSCGTHKYTVKNGKIADLNNKCCCGCKNCASNSES